MENGSKPQPAGPGPKTLTTLQWSGAPLDNNGSETEITDERRVDLINVTSYRRRTTRLQYCTYIRLDFLLPQSAEAVICDFMHCHGLVSSPEWQTKSHYLIGHLTLKG